MPETLKYYSLLYIEDDEIDKLTFERQIIKSGYRRCQYASSIQEALDVLKVDNDIDVVISDYNLPDGTALDLIHHISKVPIIFVTGVGDEGVAVEAMKAGVYDYLVKDRECNYLKKLPITILKAIRYTKNQQALKETEERYKDLFENAIDIVQILDSKGNFIFVNPSWYNTLEYTPSQINGMTIFDIVHPEYINNIKNIIQRVSNGERISNEIIHLVTIGGTRVIVEVVMYIKRKNDAIATIHGVFHDITEKTINEDKLRDSEKTYRFLVESAHDVIYEVDLEGNFTFVNAQGVSISGYLLVELLRMNFINLVYDKHKESILSFYQSQINNKTETTYYEFQLKSKDGTLLWLGQNVKIVYEEQDGKKIKGFFAVARDITERKELEEKLRKMNASLEYRIKERTALLSETNMELAHEIKLRKKTTLALKESEQDYRGLFDNAHDAIIILTPDDEVVIEANDQALKIYGYSREEFIGMSIKNISKNTVNGTGHTYKVKNSDSIQTFDITHYNKKGGEIFFEINASSVKYSGVEAILSINRDVTKRKITEKELEVVRRNYLSALIEGQELERKRLSRDLHDGLGQLISAAKMYLKRLKQSSKMDTKDHELIDDLGEILDDTVKEVRKISHNLMPSVLQDFGLSSALSNVVKMLNEKSKEKIEYISHSKIVRMEPEHEVSFYRIAQEAINNALKYANSKTISVSYLKQKDKMVLKIADDGVGFNYNNRTSRKTNGNGIYNIKQRCDIMNAEFNILSNEEKGTTITISKVI